MLGKIKDLFTPVTKLVDEIHMSKEEKAKINIEFEKIRNTLESEITKRHEKDMLSDSWLSKNIRPLALAYLLFITTVLAFIDGNIEGFNIKALYIEMFISFTGLMITFYVTSRGTEKCVSFFKKRTASK